MNSTRTTNRKPMSVKTLIPFFSMAFGLSWGLAAMAIFFADKLEPIFGPIGYTNPLFIVAVYAPGLSGIALVLRHYGIKGFGRYLRRLTLWRMPLGWAAYLVAGIPAAFYLGAWIKGSSLAFPFTPWYTVIPALLIGLAIGPMEEFGWRGVALPLLQRKFRPIVADLILSTPVGYLARAGVLPERHAAEPVVVPGLLRGRRVDLVHPHAAVQRDPRKHPDRRSLPLPDEQPDLARRPALRLARVRRDRRSRGHHQPQGDVHSRRRSDGRADAR